MLWRILKNDLRNGWMSNLVMIIFLSVSTMLACASISLIYSSTNQISYFMNDMGNTADMNFSMMNFTKQGEQDIHTFMKEKGIDEYQLEHDINLPLSVMRFNDTPDLESSGCFATTLPDTFNLLYDEFNQIPNIQKGEVGIPLSIKNQLDLKLGDTFDIQYDQKTYHYKISCFLRDPLYGSEMMGQKRILLHPDDFEVLYNVTQAKDHAAVLSVNNSKQTENLEYDMQHQGLPNYILVTKETAMLSFMGVGMGTSALLLMSGIILLCMSFFIIRFTILSQIEQHYTEIGIMKAIGFKHSQIKPLYLCKYISITLLGSIIGFLCSIPMADFLEEMQGGVVPAIPNHNGTLLSISVIFMILAMVYGVTTMVLRRLKKQSTMEAIRKGNKGETFQTHTILSLEKRSFLSVPSYLACNELLSNVKHSIMMILIYAFCMWLVLVPLTLKDSFQNDAFLQILKVSAADLYSQQNSGIRISSLQKQKEELQKDLERYDPDVKVEMETLSSASLHEQGVNSSVFLMKRADLETMEFNKGKAPLLDNEIAISGVLANRYHKTIGDTIQLSYEETKRDYIITGIYSSMMNLGNNILAGDQNYDYAYTGYLIVQFSGDEATRQTTKELVQNNYHDMKLIDSLDMMKSFSGDMPHQIELLCNLIIGIIFFILFFLTILFSKLHMIRMKTSIALLQSLGYQKRPIRKWMMVKCMLQAISAAVIGILFHTIFTSRMLSIYFQSTGLGDLKLTSDYLHTYLIYPILYILIVIIAQAIVNRTISTSHIEDLNEE